MIKSNRFKANRLAVGITAVLTLGAANSVLAEEEKILMLDVASQNIGSALVELSKSSGVQIVLSQELGDSVKLDAIKGEYTLSQALDRMLDGSGLNYEFRSEGLVVISKEDDEGTSESVEVEEEVVVTGSRIRGITITGNLLTINREDFERQGFTSAEDVVRSLTFNQGSQGSQQRTSISNQRFNSSGFTGLASADLRGLGNTATLILVNGRRLPSSPLTAIEVTDISSIPLSAIERVEVLTDGASSIYGSDAVGGVINFILRKDYSGFQSKVRYSQSANGADAYDAEFTAGFSWDGGNMMGTVSLSSEDPVATAELLNSQDFRAQGGRDFRPVAIGPTGTFFLLDPALGALAGLPAGTAAFTFPAGEVPSLSNIITDTDPTGANLPRLDYLGELELLGATDRFSVSLNGEQELSDSVVVSGDVFYSERESFTAPSTYSFGGAFFTPQPGELLAPVVPGVDPFPYRVNYSGINDFRATGDNSVLSANGNTNERYQANLGLRVDLGGDWQSKVNLAYSSEEQQSFGRSQPFASTFMIPTGFNPFGDGSNQDAAVVNALFETTGNDFESTVRGVTVNADGSLFSISGGDVRLALGLEVREEEFGAKGANSSLFGGERSVESAFAEFNIPLVGDNNTVPGIESLILTAAGRYENYDQQAVVVDARTGVPATTEVNDLSAFSPSLGLAWQPLDDWTVRLNWSESFQIPLVTQLISPDVFFTIPIPDATSPIGFTFTEIQIVGNPNLSEQVGETWSLGTEWAPAFAPDWNFKATYNRIDIEDVIGNLLNFSTDFGTLLATGNDIIPGSVIRNPDGTAALNLGPINFARQLSESIDFDLTHQTETSFGTISSRLLATRTFSNELFTASGGTGNRAGTINGPSDWKMRASVAWDHDAWSATAILNYEDGYLNNNAGVLTDQVDSYTTFDLQGSYEVADWLDGTKITLGAINLFNASFPFVDNQFGFEGTRVDFRGRRFYLEIKSEF